MKGKIVFILLVYLSLAACRPAGPAPTPTAPVLVTIPPPPTSPVTRPATLTPAPVVDTPAGTATPPTGSATVVPEPDGTPSPAGLTAPEQEATPSLTTVPAVDSAPSCQKPAGWVNYTVQSGDTLSSLARRTNMTAAEIQRVNCLASTLILAGQPLFLPRPPATGPTQTRSGLLPSATAELPPAPTTTPMPFSTPTPTPEDLPAPGPGGERVEVSPPSGPAGTVFTILIESFQPNEAIVLYVTNAATFEVIVEAPLVVDGQGNYTYPYASPPNSPPGFFRVRAEGAEAAANGEFSIVATAPNNTDTPGITPPATGTTPSPVTPAGVTPSPTPVFTPTLLPPSLTPALPTASATTAPTAPPEPTEIPSP